jgi:hypothetical protein
MSAARPGMPAHVVRIEPPDGARGVLRDDPVVAFLSHPVDAASLTPQTFRVAGPAGPAAGKLRVSPDGRVVVWLPERLLDPNGEHEIRVAGLRDARGHDVEPYTSRFVPCRLTASDVMG